MSKKILLTGAGAPGGPGIIKALLKAGFSVVTADSNPFASGRFLHPDFIQIPRADDEDFISFVLDYSIKNNIDVVFPLVTKELFKFSSAKQLFEDSGIKVMVSDFESLSIANDKGKLYQHLAGYESAIPKFRIVEKVEDLAHAAYSLGYPGIPVCIKPTVSNGSRGVRILQEGIDEFDLLFNHKPNHLYSTLDRIRQILHGRKLPPVLVSEFLPGMEYTVDTLVQNGRPVLILPRSREKMNAGISVQGTFLRNEKIIEHCANILASLNLSGPIGFQFKEDGNGEYKLLEINPRIQGTSVAALGIGINLPALAVQQEFESIHVDTADIEWGTSFVRYYDEIFYK